MILPGRQLIPQVIRNIRSPKIQSQSCGVDLTLKRILTWTSPGMIDFDNSRRQKASNRVIPFDVRPDPNAPSLHREHSQPSSSPDENYAHLSAGAYLVEFNETVDVPLDLMGEIFVRSSLFRSGATLHAGVMDSGYRGAVGALLHVLNPAGLGVYRDARLAQMVFHQMSEKVDGYSGTYQGGRTV